MARLSPGLSRWQHASDSRNINVERGRKEHLRISEVQYREGGGRKGELYEARTEHRRTLGIGK